MVTIAAEAPAPTARHYPLAADRYERILAVASTVLLAAVVVALAKGYPEWGRISLAVWAHLATITVALALTTVMLLRVRGDAPDGALG